MIRVVRFRPFVKNTLKAFCDFELTRVGIVLRYCTWHVHEGGREWIGFPATPYEGDAGAQRWPPIVEFAEGAREARRQFLEQALDAVHEAVAQQNGEAHV